MKSLAVIALFCCLISGCTTPITERTAENEVAIENPLNENIVNEGKAGCAVISASLRMHWAERGNYDGIKTPFDTSALSPGDLNGTYFNDKSYSFESLVSWDNLVIVATGVGEATGTRFIYSIVDGKPEWKIEKTQPDKK